MVQLRPMTVVLDGGAPEDLGVVADDHRPLKGGGILQPDVGADAQVLPHDVLLRLVDLHIDLAAKDVVVRLAVRIGVADVPPVPLHREAVERCPHFEELGEEILGKVVILPFGDLGQNLRFQDVDAGVDGVGDHLAPAGLLQELDDLLFLVGDDDSELERVLDRGEGYGGQGLALFMEVDAPSGG